MWLATGKNMRTSAYRYRKLLWVVASLLAVFVLLNFIFPPNLSVSYSPRVLDANGHLVHIALSEDEKWRLPVEENDITPLLEKAILTKEDRWFYQHPGVNPLAILRALGRNIVRGKTTSGASTITMQVARLLEPRPRHIGSKLIEMVRAMQIEMRLSKKEILCLYLNLAPYGGNIEGIRSAAYFYLQKEPNHLSLAEITALSIIPNRPNSLTPGRQNTAIVQERNRWLQWFANKGTFSQKQIADALREPFDAERQPAPRYAPHISRTLLRGKTSPNIKTTLQLNMQLQSEKILGDYIRSLQAYGIHNAAAVVVDNQTRSVLAYVGSANFFDTTDGGQVNGAAAVRQPGSTLKPILYGLAFDAGMLTPKTMIPDVPINYGGYVPENYDQRFNGLVSAEYALMHSLNIPAVNTLRLIGKERLLSTLALCRFNQIKKDQNKLGLSMILGGCGTTLEELTGLYCAIANNGMYQPLRFLQTGKASPGIRILTQEASFLLHETLSQTDRPDLPVNWSSTESLPKIAWKTGTSYGRRDAWSIGYNQRYTIGVWVGNFSGKGIPELSGSSIATPLLFRLFNAIDRQSHTQWYSPGTHLEQRMVCTESGLTPGPQCQQIVMDYFIPLVSPRAICEHQKEVSVSPDERISYCVYCQPAAGYRKKWFAVFPEEVQAFMEQHQASKTTIPPHNPGCTQVWDEKGPLIKSPKHQSEYFLSKQHPEPLALECQPAADVAMVHWYINDRFYKSTPARQKIFFMPDAGRQKISCTDDKGRNRNVVIEVSIIDL